MRIVRIVVVFVLVYGTAAAQRPDSNDASQSPPHRPCSFDRVHAVTRRVKDAAPVDYSFGFQTPLRFQVGALVVVSSVDGDWSCATGSVRISDKWVTRTGWVQSPLLEIPKE